jgi:hypothetical protein
VCFGRLQSDGTHGFEERGVSISEKATDVAHGYSYDWTFHYMNDSKLRRLLDTHSPPGYHSLSPYHIYACSRNYS